MATPSHRTSAARRERILRLSATLFAEKGYQAVGVAEIGARVGLGRGALYYHIGSKEQLLYDIVLQYISEMVAEGTRVLRDTTDHRGRIVQLSQGMMEIISTNKAELTVCFREAENLTGARHAAVAKLHADYQALWARTIEDGYRAGVFRRLKPVALKGLLGMYFHSFLWLNPQGESSAAEIADVFSDIVLRALAREPATAADTR